MSKKKKEFNVYITLLSADKINEFFSSLRDDEISVKALYHNNVISEEVKNYIGVILSLSIIANKKTDLFKEYKFNPAGIRRILEEKLLELDMSYFSIVVNCITRVSADWIGSNISLEQIKVVL